jgi:hypothetical protein
VAADANLDDEFGGCGVGQAEVADHATHDREIRFRFRVRAGDGLLGTDDEALRHRSPEDFEQKPEQVGVER